MPIINSFIKEVYCVKGPNRIVYQRCLEVAMSWIGPDSVALITLEWLVLVKVSVRSDQCLCWGLWLSNGAYPDILHSLCLTHSHTQTKFFRVLQVSRSSKPGPYVKTEIIWAYKWKPTIDASTYLRLNECSSWLLFSVQVGSFDVMYFLLFLDNRNQLWSFLLYVVHKSSFSLHTGDALVFPHAIVRIHK